MSTTHLEDRAARTKPGILLWTLQGLLAALFAFAGVAKLLMPVATLAKMSGLPGGLMELVAVAECCGAFGLVLPGLLRVRARLTPLAAAGLVIIMIGATTITARTQGVLPALFPCVVGVLAAVVAVGRWRWAPLRSATPRRALPLSDSAS